MNIPKQERIEFKRVPIDTLHEDPANARAHPERNRATVRASLLEFGQVEPLVVQKGTGRVIGGNCRLGELRAIGAEDVMVAEVEIDGTDATRLGLVLNRSAETAEWDTDNLTALLRSLGEDDAALDLGWSEEELNDLIADESDPGPTGPPPSLADEFGVPPFSVLDARQGYWQERKRRWLDMGIRSEIGRGGVGAYPTTGSAACVTDSITERSAQRASPGGSRRPAASLGADGKTRRGDGAGRLTWVQGDRAEEDLDEASRKILAAQPESGTSIFDPVLCELSYRWFSPQDGSVLDPFAGGSVRGVVASCCGLAYTGIELRSEQVAANEDQAALGTGPAPRWIVGDSRNAATLAPGAYDLIFSCPPYADLERYSDDPADISTMDYADFLVAYREIVAACVDMLAPDRFAVFVVGDVRDKRGFYRNFPADTIAAFQDAGAILYNEAILVTAIGSLPLRVRKQFQSGRKLGKTHQNVLVFYKGNPRKIRGFGDVIVVEHDQDPGPGALE